MSEGTWYFVSTHFTVAAENKGIKEFPPLIKWQIRHDQPEQSNNSSSLQTHRGELNTCSALAFTYRRLPGPLVLETKDQVMHCLCHQSQQQKEQYT